MLKILQVRLQQSVNCELSDVLAGFRKLEEQTSNCKYPLGHGKSKRVPENIYFCFIDYTKAIDCVDHNKLWKILQEIGIPDQLICPLRNLYAGQEEIVRPGHGTTKCFQIRKGVSKAVYCHPAYLTHMQSTP